MITHKLFTSEIISGLILTWLQSIWILCFQPEVVIITDKDNVVAVLCICMWLMFHYVLIIHHLLLCESVAIKRNVWRGRAELCLIWWVDFLPFILFIIYPFIIYSLVWLMVTDNSVLHFCLGLVQLTDCSCANWWDCTQLLLTTLPNCPKLYT